MGDLEIRVEFGILDRVHVKVRLLDLLTNLYTFIRTHDTFCETEVYFKKRKPHGYLFVYLLILYTC